MRDPDFTLSAGPVTTSHRVNAALGRPIVYHYDPTFLANYSLINVNDASIKSAHAAGLAPAITNSRASANVPSLVPSNMNEPVSVRTAVYKQVATSGEMRTPASRARR